MRLAQEFDNRIQSLSSSGHWFIAIFSQQIVRVVPISELFCGLYEMSCWPQSGSSWTDVDIVKQLLPPALLVSVGELGSE